MVERSLQLKSESCRTKQGFLKMRVSLFDGDTLLQQTVMGIEDYITMLQNSHRRQESPTTLFIGDVPAGFVDGFVSNTEGTLGAIIYLPPRKHQFILAGVEGGREKKAYYIPMPGLVYEVVANKGTMHTFRCFAFKEWNGDETELFHYPYGNVSDSGSICMGSVSRVKVTSYTDIRENIENSLNGVTNSDYLDGDDCRLSVKVSQHDFCDQLEKEESEQFPMELLLAHPMGNVKTLRSDFRNIVKTL